MNKCRLGVLLSGRGSNFRAIAEAITSGRLTQADIAVVISNKASAPGLTYAESQNIPTVVVSAKDYPDKADFDRAVLAALHQHQVDILILAGYMRIITPVLLGAYPGRILNIHPSLLPAYGGPGMMGETVHQAVLAAGEQLSGCTVHIVTDVVDGGPVLGQAQVSVEPDDTPETLAQKVLAQEHQLYPQVIADFITQQYPQCKETSHAT